MAEPSPRRYIIVSCCFLFNLMKNLVNYFPLKVFIKVKGFGAETLMEFFVVGRVISVNVGENHKEANFD